MVKRTKKFVKNKMKFRRVEPIRLEVQIEDQPVLIVTLNEPNRPDPQQQRESAEPARWTRFQKNISAFVRSTTFLCRKTTTTSNRRRRDSSSRLELRLRQRRSDKFV